MIILQVSNSTLSSLHSGGHLERGKGGRGKDTDREETVSNSGVLLRRLLIEKICVETFEFDVTENISTTLLLLYEEIHKQERFKKKIPIMIQAKEKYRHKKRGIYLVQR